LFPQLYAILDPQVTAAPLATLAAALADAGVRLIQLRDKGGNPGRVFAQSRELAAQLSARGVKFIVNDRPDLAAISGAAGAHVGQQDLAVEEARRVCAAPLWVGVSTHNLKQLREAQSL
jgi:thiamine-phosphate pyrophosphorylase